MIQYKDCALNQIFIISNGTVLMRLGGTNLVLCNHSLFPQDKGITKLDLASDVTIKPITLSDAFQHINCGGCTKNLTRLFLARHRLTNVIS